MAEQGRLRRLQTDSQQGRTHFECELAEQSVDAQGPLKMERDAAPQGLVAAEVVVELSCLTLLLFWERAETVPEDPHDQSQPPGSWSVGGDVRSPAKMKPAQQFRAGVGREYWTPSVSSFSLESGVSERDEQGAENRSGHEGGSGPLGFLSCGGVCSPVDADSSSEGSYSSEAYTVPRRRGSCPEPFLLSSTCKKATCSIAMNGVNVAPSAALPCCACCESKRTQGSGGQIKKAARFGSSRQLCVGLVCVGVQASACTGLSDTSASSSGCAYRCSSHAFAVVVPRRGLSRRLKAQTSCAALGRWSRSESRWLGKGNSVSPPRGAANFSRRAGPRRTIRQWFPVSADALGREATFGNLTRDSRPFLQTEGMSLHKLKTAGREDSVGDSRRKRLGGHSRSWSVSGIVDVRRRRGLVYGVPSSISDKSKRRRGRRADCTDRCCVFVNGGDVPDEEQRADVSVSAKDLFSVSGAGSWDRARTLRECRRDLLSPGKAGAPHRGDRQSRLQEAVLLLYAIGKEKQLDPTTVTQSPPAPALFSPWPALANFVPVGAQGLSERRPEPPPDRQRPRRTEPGLQIFGGLPSAAAWLPGCLALPRLAERVSSVFRLSSAGDPGNGVLRATEAEELTQEEQEETAQLLADVSRAAMKATLFDALHHANVSVLAAAQACTFRGCLGFCSCGSQVYKRSVFPPLLPPSALGGRDTSKRRDTRRACNGAMDVRPRWGGAGSVTLREQANGGRQGQTRATKQLVILDRSSGLRWVVGLEEIGAALDGADGWDSGGSKHSFEAYVDPVATDGETPAYHAIVWADRARRSKNSGSAFRDDHHQADNVECTKAGGQPDLEIGGDICFDSLRQSLQVVVQPYRLVGDWEAFADIAGKTRLETRR